MAVGPQQGRKVFTLQTLPASDEPFDDGVGKMAGFSMHAGVAARADQRQKLERLSEGGPAAISAGPPSFNTLNNKEIFIVTRQKRNATYRVIERHAVLKSKGLTCDQTILITGAKAKACPIPLRPIGYRDPETGKHYVFLTNNFRLAAKTIADIYKARWQIELFFKCIKQNLKIKSFVGTSKNAVLTAQIWVAMCTYLLLAWIKFSSGTDRSLQQIIRLLQLNLFDRRELLDL